MDLHQRGVRLRALAQQHDARDHVVVIDDVAVGQMPRPPELAQPHLGALFHHADVANAQGRAVLGGEHGVGDVLHIAHQAHFAHIDLLRACLDEIAAAVDIVVGELLLHLIDVQAIGDQLGRIQADLIFARGTAEAGDIHHVRHGLEGLLHHPVFQRFQLHHVVPRIGAVQREEVDLADRAPIGPDLRLQPLREHDLRETLDHFDAIPVVGGLVVEDHGDAGESGERDGAEILQVRNPVHHDFDGDGDLLLHLFGRAAGPLRDHCDVVVGDVGIRLDGQIVEGNAAPDREQNGDRENDETITESEIDECPDHLYPPGQLKTLLWNRCLRTIKQTSAIVT